MHDSHGEVRDRADPDGRTKRQHCDGKAEFSKFSCGRWHRGGVALRVFTCDFICRHLRIAVHKWQCEHERGKRRCGERYAPKVRGNTDEICQEHSVDGSCDLSAE